MALFAVNTGLRNDNVCGLEWSWEVDVPEIGRSVFVVPAEEFKSKRDHVVILNDAAWSIIQSQRGLHPIWVFPFPRAPRPEHEQQWLAEGARRCWTAPCARARPAPYLCMSAACSGCAIGGSVDAARARRSLDVGPLRECRRRPSNAASKSRIESTGDSHAWLRAIRASASAMMRSISSSTEAGSASCRQAALGPLRVRCLRRSRRRLARTRRVPARGRPSRLAQQVRVQELHHAPVGLDLVLLLA